MLDNLSRTYNQPVAHCFSKGGKISDCRITGLHYGINYPFPTITLISQPYLEKNTTFPAWLIKQKNDKEFQIKQ